VSISSGEILLSQDVPEKDEDWIFVVKLNNSQERGFVPAGFVAALSAAESARYISAWNTGEMEGSYTPLAFTSDPSSSFAGSSYSHTSPPGLASPLTEQHLSTPALNNTKNISTLPTPTRLFDERVFSSTKPKASESRERTSISTTPTPYNSTLQTPSFMSTNLPSSSALPASLYSNSSASPTPLTPSTFSQSKPLSTTNGSAASSASVIDMFNKHEAYLRQVMKQREEKFKDLEKSVVFTGQEIEKYKLMNDTLYQKILKLESTLETEHSKLKQRIVDEERRAATPQQSFSHSSPIPQ